MVYFCSLSMVSFTLNHIYYSCFKVFFWYPMSGLSGRQFLLITSITMYGHSFKFGLEHILFNSGLNNNSYIELVPCLSMSTKYSSCQILEVGLFSHA